MCVAPRIKEHVCLHLIHYDRTGFIKGRYIEENINKILSVMDLNQNNNIPAVLGMIDSEKEFDSIEWSFIQKNPNFFNFGDSILN